MGENYYEERTGGLTIRSGWTNYYEERTGELTIGILIRSGNVGRTIHSVGMSRTIHSKTCSSKTCSSKIGEELQE